MVVQLTRYEIVRHLGGGGMGDVYLAHLRGRGGFQRPFAVKVMRPDIAVSERGVELFLREAAFLSGLRHRNIVQVFELAEDNGCLYLAMELLDGVSLRQLAAATGGRLSPTAVAWVAREVARGLHAAHTAVLPGAPRGVIHRDLSPSNVMTCLDGAVKILDFGLARPVGQMPSVSAVEGKLAFLAPESLAGLALDARADVYALGVSMYELLTGALPFDSAGPLVVMRAIESGDYAPMSSHGVSVPGGLGEVVSCAMSRDRGKRFATARDLEQALGPYVGDFDENALAALVADAQGDHGTSSPHASHAARAPRLRRIWLAGVAVATISIAAGVTIAVGSSRSTARAAGISPPASAAPAPTTAADDRPARAPASPTVEAAAQPPTTQQRAPTAASPQREPPSRTAAHVTRSKTSKQAPRTMGTPSSVTAPTAPTTAPTAPTTAPTAPTTAPPGVLLDPFGKH